MPNQSEVHAEHQLRVDEISSLYRGLDLDPMDKTKLMAILGGDVSW